MIPRLACLVSVLSGLYSHGVSSAATTDSNHPSRIVEIDGIDTSNVTVFNCPPGTRGDASLESIQLAMDDFAYTFYTEKNVKAAFKQYVASNYVQHNPGIVDGRDAAIKALEPLFGSSEHGFNVSRDELHSNLCVHLLIPYRLPESWWGKSTRLSISRQPTRAGHLIMCLMSIERRVHASLNTGIAWRRFLTKQYRPTRTFKRGLQLGSRSLLYVNTPFPLTSFRN